MVFDRKAYMKEYDREYRKNNKDRIKEHNKKYYENNKDREKERVKEWYEKNKEHKKEHQKEWYENNKDRIKEQSKEYRQTEEAQMIYKILDWERRGIIYYDMKELYYTWKMTKYCNYCNVELVEGNYGSNKKCLDHDHETGEPRGVICQACNLRDVFKNC